jgi:hypothetical protein
MAENDKSIADALGVTEYDDTPVVGRSIADHAMQFAAADDLGDLAAASGSLLSDGAAFVGKAALDATMYLFDPVGWLTSHGLDLLLEIVKPLQDWLHAVTGDGPAIGHASDNFVTIAQGFVELADDFEKTGDTALKDWLDEAGEAARLALGDFSAGIRGVGSSAGSVAEVLKMWSMVMVVIEDVIKAIISEFAAWAVTVWASAFATSVISFGGSIATAMTASVEKAATALQKVTKHLGVFGKLLDGFMKLLKKLTKVVTTLAERFRVGKYVEKGERALPFIGAAPIGRVAEETSLKLSNRLAAKTLGAGAVGPLLKGVGIKSSIAAGKGVLGTGADALDDDSEIGGGQSVEETHEDLDM